MGSSLSISNIQTALAERQFPSVTMLNRLEGRPRTVAFDRALRAEVRDALWMLTKQWQMGEFRGTDAGSPVFAKVMPQTTRLTKYRPDTAATEPFPYDTCFETKVERRTIPLTVGGRPASWDLRFMMGRYWSKLLGTLGTDYRANFIAAYPVQKPDPTDVTQADVCAHLEVWQTMEAAAGRALDGGAIYAHLTANPGNHAYDTVAGVAAADYAAIDALAAKFVAWFQRTFSEPPAGDSAWVPPVLEYQFAASAPLPSGGETVYVADEYYAGRLDWFSLDVDSTIAQLDDVPGSAVTGLPVDAPRSMIPTPVSFAGMPNTRWWTFEDRATNFGDIDAATTDLAKLLFLEFALVYSNDWFVIPYSLPLGAIAKIEGMVVTNVFGERQWIPAAGSGADANWQHWAMFTINTQGAADAQTDTSLLILPTATKIQQGEPVEDVTLFRDEAANMVWGVEKTVTLVTGEPKRGVEVAREATAFFEGIVAAENGGAIPAPAIPPVAPIRYQVMSSVPENWIPFIPVHIPGDTRKIQLQRASMPRIVGDNAQALPAALRKVKPRTVLLREGLDAMPAQAYYVHEEEVPRAGARVFQAFQRARSCDNGTECGHVQTWLRVQKQTGRGEGASGLAFDELLDVTVPKKAGA